MSFNQGKVLTQIKETLAKLVSEKPLQSPSSKRFLEIVKLPSYLYNKEIGKYLDFKTNVSVLKYLGSVGSSSNLPIALRDLKGKIAVNSFGNEEKSKKTKWKQTSKSADIISITEQILLSIESSLSEEFVLVAVEGLIAHIKQHPEARIKAIKMGAIRLLLRIRLKTKNELIQNSIREALAVLGYVDPVAGKGIRVLSIDGGGIRGLLVLEMLKKLEELTGKRVHELFDIFCGVSTGAILSFSMGYHQNTLDDIYKGYESLSREVFKQSALWGTGNLMWSHAYYDTSLWEKKLKEHLGSDTLISTSRSLHCPKLCAVSAIVNQSRLSAYVFRNYSLPWRFQSHYMGGYDHEIWQAARASAAAPTYFEEFKLGNLLHQDGGILVNNPTAIALHEVKLLWPNTPLQCVVSFGTGRTVPSPSEFSETPKHSEKLSGSTSWANKFYKILDSATDTEAVHTMLSDLLPEGVYYRFNPYLTEMISMVETDPKKLEQLKRDALMYLRRNEDKFQKAAVVLLQKKNVSQKVKDYMNLQIEKYGF